MKTLGEMADRAARVLPDGWTIGVHMGKQAGRVELSFDGYTVHFPTNGEGIEQSFDDALAFACKADVYRCPQCGYLTPWADGTETDVWCRTCGHEFEADAHLVRAAPPAATPEDL